MIDLPDYAPIDEPYITIRAWNEALQEKTGGIVYLRLATALFDGNRCSLRLSNANQNWQDIANFVPAFTALNYPATITLAIKGEMLTADDSEWLDEQGWDLDCEYPYVSVCNPGELTIALDGLFQSDFVTVMICELMSNRPRVTL
jgi:hypothetical protein